MRFFAVVLAAMSFIVLSGGAVAQQPSSTDSNAEEQVQQVAEAFIHAFNNLDWDAFRTSFSDDATVFFPMPGLARRATGRSEVEGSFRSVFDEVRRRRTGPPYLNIDPKDMHIQILQDAAVVTFHLEGSELLNRRTVVFQKREGRWLIVHLHASEESTPHQKIVGRLTPGWSRRGPGRLTGCGWMRRAASYGRCLLPIADSPSSIATG